MPSIQNSLAYTSKFVAETSLCQTTAQRSLTREAEMRGAVSGDGQAAIP